MADALPLRLFLASPGDLKDERSVVRSCVAEYNERPASDSGVTFEVVEWARTRGTARRAQEAINELIAESHFLVALFKQSWGSAPGGPWGYTSGTEEELFTALLELGQLEQPMRDIWIGFINDPTPDARIANLRRAIIDSHSLLFESIEGPRDLKDKLSVRLQSWKELADTKVPRHIDLLPSSGSDVLRAANLRLRGEKLIELGQTEVGQSSLREAAVIGGPVEHLSYAHHLRRAGDLEGAYDHTQKAIHYFLEGAPLYSTLAAESFAAQARVLVAQVRVHDAIGRLQHALTLIVGDDVNAQTTRSRIHDDLGLAYRKVDDPESARQHFETSLALRRELGRESDVSQSLINLARLEVSAGELPTAADLALEAMSVLAGTAPSNVRANAEVFMAQIRLRQGSPDKGIPHARWALSINQQIANRHGEAISLLVLAQCLRAAGQDAEARVNAQACLNVNEAIGDAHGVAKAQWLLDHLTT